MSEESMGGIGSSPKKYNGFYPALVVGSDDAQRFLRARVRVFELFDNVPDKDLPLAEYMLPIGFRQNQGCFVPAEPGDYVIVIFPYGGDTRRPVIAGSLLFCPGGLPNAPHEAWEGPDAHTHVRTTPQLTPTDASYHKDIVFSQFGVLVEVIKDTGEVRVTQKASGSAIEIDKAGNITIHSETNLYCSATGNTQIDVDGTATVNIVGNTTLECEGKVEITAASTVEIDGGSGDVKGIVQGDCLCPITGQPHVMISSNVKGSV